MKYYFVIAALFVFKTSFSQVVINAQLPTLGIYTKNQLWSLSLTNTSQEQPEVKIELSFTDNATGQSIFTATTKSIYLTKGVKQIQLNEISPIVYTIANSNYGVDASPNGFLPIGVFVVCYRLLKLNNDAVEQLAEECETIEVEPTSPPTLVEPFNNDQIDAERPLFTWLPPMPMNLFSNLSYDLKLVVINQTQSESDAIQQNVPVYQRSNISTTSEPYPAGYAALDTGKKYAWQIIAKSNGISIATSEVWIFSLKNQSNEPIIMRDGVYAKLKKIEDPSFIICNGNLQYEYVNEKNESSLIVNLFDVTSSKRIEVPMDSSSVGIRYGTNYIKMNIDEIANVSNNHFYLLEVISTASNEKYYLRFQYKQAQ